MCVFQHQTLIMQLFWQMNGMQMFVVKCVDMCCEGFCITTATSIFVHIIILDGKILYSLKFIIYEQIYFVIILKGFR